MQKKENAFGQLAESNEKQGSWRAWSAEFEALQQESIVQMVMEI